MHHRVARSLLTVAAVIGTATAGAQETDPQAILAAARQALGGDRALSAVRLFIVTGSANRKLGDRVVDQATEIAYQAPDRYVRIASYDAMVGGPLGLHLITTTRNGLRGPDLIAESTMEGLNVRPSPPVGTPAQREATERAALRRQHQAFARLSLALFAASEPGYPVVFTSLGRVTLPDGTAADALEGRAEDGDTVRIFLDAASHLPVLLSWRELAGFTSAQDAYAGAVSSGVNRALQTVTSGAAGVGGKPEGSAGPPAADTGAPRPIAERTWALSEDRTADGVNWPHRFVERADGKVVETLTLGKYKLNAKVPDDKFKVAGPSR